jgi:hypothetical protein
MILSKIKSFRYSLVFVFLLFTIPVVNSCRYYTFSGAETGTAKTISIQFIQNKAPLVSPTLSQVFTEKLKDKFIRETTLRLVDTDGDMQLSGTIVDYAITPVALQGTAQSSKNRLTIKSNIKFTNKTAEKYNFEQVFQNFSDFDASINFSAEERNLNETVMNMMVQDVFNKAVINW